MKFLPKKLRKQLKFRQEWDEVTLAGKKGGQVKKRRVEARQIDRELQDYAYR